MAFAGGAEVGTDIVFGAVLSRSGMATTHHVTTHHATTSHATTSHALGAIGSKEAFAVQDQDELDQEEGTVDAAAKDQAEVKFFEEKIRPLLLTHCIDCHGAEQQEGSLRLDRRQSMLQGGNSGAAVVPKHPEQSLLMDAVHYRSFEMPPDGPLSDDQVRALERWITFGAVWPDQAQLSLARETEGSPAGGFSTAQRSHWAFQPIHSKQPPDVRDETWCQTDIDHFILNRLEAANLLPAAEADRRALIRRVTFDLTGLPPTREAIRDFLNDQRPDAYERLVQSLLDSPRFGERQAQMWLDVVRYADSDGYKADFVRPLAWRYRDYVIRSFNEDKPYDRFVLEQLAGDEIAPEDPDAIIATGYLRHWIYEFNQRDAETQRQLILDDITETTADAFLAMGFSCARCHDHKYDPIRQRDYFRLQAFFNSIRPIDLPAATPEQVAEYRAAMRVWEEATQVIRDRLRELEAEAMEAAKRGAVTKFTAEIQANYHKPSQERSTYEQQIWQLVHLQVLDDQQKVNVAKKLKGESLEEWKQLTEELAKFASLRPQPLPEAMAVIDWSDVPAETRIPGRDASTVVLPGWMEIFGGGDAQVTSPDGVTSTGRRSALARWIVSDQNPLASRVIVNRIWQQYFGRGLVATPNDFGRLGEKSTHPELLDFLAQKLIDQGWSLKQLHYDIVTSSAYRQTSLVADDTDFRRIDPNNDLLWKMRRRRLDAGQLRDALLAVSSELDLRMGGTPSQLDHHRRTIYQRVKRNEPDWLLASFDAPGRISSVGRRLETITPNQALTLMNSSWMQERYAAVAARFPEVKTFDDVLATYDALHETVLGRLPTSQETAYVAAFVREASEGSGEMPTSDNVDAVWLDLTSVLLNTNEFLYLD